MYSNLENEISELHDEICALSDVAFIECTLCGQCAGSCTVGINMPSVMRAIRTMAATAGVAPREAVTALENDL